MEALFGLPGHVAPMRVGIDSLDYVDPASAIHRDLTFFRRQVGGLNVAGLPVYTLRNLTTGEVREMQLATVDTPASLRQKLQIPEPLVAPRTMPTALRPMASTAPAPTPIPNACLASAAIWRQRKPARRVNTTSVSP